MEFGALSMKRSCLTRRLAAALLVPLLIAAVTEPTHTSRPPVGRRYEADTWLYAHRYGIPPGLAELVLTTAERHQIPPTTAFRLVRTESGFRVRVISDSGAVGLAQVKPSTARLACPEGTQLSDPRQNLDCGFSYLRRMLRRYRGRWSRALAAYNMGPSVADTLSQPDTLRYLRRVLASAR